MKFEIEFSVISKYNLYLIITQFKITNNLYNLIILPASQAILLLFRRWNIKNLNFLDKLPW